MLIDYRRRWTPFTTSSLQSYCMLASSWELDEFGDISEYFPSLSIIHAMGESKSKYNPLFNLKRKTRKILEEFTFNLME